MKKIYFLFLFYIFFAVTILSFLEVEAMTRSRAKFWVPPTASIVLEDPTTGNPIPNAGQGTWPRNSTFNIDVSGSASTFGVKEVRFSSDKLLNGIPGGTWIGPYNWNESSGDWDAGNKIMKWRIDDTGDYEVWVEVKSITGLSSQNFDTLTLSQVPPGVRTADETWLYCTDSLHPILNWTYADGTQASYWIQIDNTSASFPSPEVDTGEISSSSQSYVTSYSFIWNTKYWWRVKVKNQQGVWSGWSNTANFTTPKHAYPKPDFTFLPLEPAMNETVQFTDASQSYGGTTINSWSWTFQDGSPASSSSQNPQTKFTSVGSKQVSLGVRDSDGYDCGVTNSADAASKIIDIAFPLPKWKEIIPRF